MKSKKDNKEKLSPLFLNLIRTIPTIWDANWDDMKYS